MKSKNSNRYKMTLAEYERSAADKKADKSALAKINARRAKRDPKALKQKY